MLKEKLKKQAVIFVCSYAIFQKRRDFSGLKLQKNTARTVLMSGLIGNIFEGKSLYIAKSESC